MIQIFFRISNIMLLLGILLLSISIQTSILNQSFFFWLYPTFHILLVTWCSLNKSLEEGGITVLLIGFIYEIHTSAPSGLIPLTLILIYFIGLFLSSIFFLRSKIFFATVSAIYFLLFKILMVFFIYLLKSKFTYPQNFLKECFFGFLSNILFGIWFFPILIKINEITNSSPIDDRSQQKSFSK